LAVVDVADVLACCSAAGCQIEAAVGDSEGGDGESGGERERDSETATVRQRER
jgi:hypothetical protein